MLTMMTTPDPQRRWYRLSPGRLVLGLLALEGFLLLSERLAGSPSTSTRAGPCSSPWRAWAALLFFFLWFAASLLFRWRFQYSIRSLLVLTLAVAVACSWLSWEMKKAREQKATVEWIRVRDLAMREYDYELDANGDELVQFDLEPSGPKWLRRLLGDDFFNDVVRLDVCSFTDDDLEKVKGLTELQGLELYGCKLTGDGLRHVNPSHLRKLNLAATKVTDDSLKNLERFTQLEELELGQNMDGISDEGLKHLLPLKRLRRLDLGVTEIDNLGLMYIEPLTQLRDLDVTHTNVSAEGVKDFQQALPRCQIHHDEW